MNINQEIDPKILERVKDYEGKIEEMNKFNNLHMITEDIETEQDLPDVAEYIHNNYNSMDENEMGNLLIQHTPINKIRRELLNIEFKYYIPESVNDMSFDRYITTAVPFLNRFLLTTVGSEFEDTEWNIHNFSSDKFKLEENQIVFEITSPIIPSKKSLIYNLKKILNNICDSIDVKYRTMSIRNTNLIIFKCTHKNMEINKIGL